MANIPETIEALATGKGVYRGEPLFVMADGSVEDKDGRQVAPASELGAAAYSSFVGYASNSAPTATVRGGVSLTAGKLYTDGTDLYVYGSGSLAKI